MDSSHSHLSIHTVTSRLSTTFKSQQCTTFCLNFYEIRIATVSGKPSAKRQDQDSESSPRRVFRRECVPTKCATLLFLRSTKAAPKMFKRGGRSSPQATLAKISIRVTTLQCHHLADHTQSTHTVPDQLSTKGSTRLQLERRTASHHT